MYDPLKHWGATEGKKMTIGIVGIGGLGTMGIKLSKALGHDVMAISTSANKEALAKEKGATHFCVSTNAESVTANSGLCDLILNTVSANHDLNVYMPLLAKSGTIVQLGLAPAPHPISQLPLMFTRKSVAGSLIGGIAATEEVLELCAKHNILPDCQTITASKIDWAWEQLLGEGGNKDGVRYVIDIKASLEDKDFIPK
jgi:alcohol dehydrogenase (NADP+)